MKSTRRVLHLLLLHLTVIGKVLGGDVTYDGRSLIIEGQRKLLFSGSIHYPRSTPEMWPSLIFKAKDGGIDVIDTYVFWNLHEPQPGQYDFSGRLDIIGFMKQIQAQGLYACLRIGPFIESEWSYGGMPFWLRDIPNIIYRSSNEPFEDRMQNFTTKIVRMLQAENLFASQGGPIIISQIENEYSMVEKAFHDMGPPYVQWAAEMAVSLQTGVPWVMCKQDDAPDPVINACNGMRCGETFVGPNSPNKPSLWTENWTARYKVYGEDEVMRPVEDIAYQVALFIAAKNGSFINYYMYHGGTNFGRTASAFIPTAYYDEAPLDEYGMIREPKWGHLRELHSAVKLCSSALLSGARVGVSFGENQYGYVFNGNSGECAAFLINSGSQNASVVFRNSSYDLPSQSVSILPDCKNVAFNTAKVNTQQTVRTMASVTVLSSADMWKEYKEGVPNFDDTNLKAETILEHTSTTKDASDYLWYTLRHESEFSDANAALDVRSLGHVLHAYINGKAVGSARGSKQSPRFNLSVAISLNEGTNNISLLSAMVGLPDSGAYLEAKDFGPYKVIIQDKQGNKNLSSHSWGYQVGLSGETLQIYSGLGSEVQWNNFSVAGNPLTWYKATFDAPKVDAPVALNLGSMGKGEAWINGQSIGRYWPSYRSPSGSSQLRYNVPRSFLKPTGNQLVVLEEEGGNPLEISVDTALISQVCNHITTSDLPPVSSWIAIYNRQPTKSSKHIIKRPKVRLACPKRSKISGISFASYGTPLGSCGTFYAIGDCHSYNSKAPIEKACIGKRRCSIPVMNHYFGNDPCPGTTKSLLVVAECK